MTSISIEELMSSSLVYWVCSVRNVPLTEISYDTLLDGVFLYDTMLHIYSDMPHRGAIDVLSTECDVTYRRVNNLSIVLHNIIAFYQDTLSQLLVSQLPNIISLVMNDAESSAEMRLLLTLILGCAVQCSNKQTFIDAIKQFDICRQRDLVVFIQQVTENVDNVITTEMVHTAENCKLLMKHVMYSIDERNRIYFELINSFLNELQTHRKQRVPSAQSSEAAGEPCAESLTRHVHSRVELADCRLRLSHVLQELDEKCEQIQDLDKALDSAKRSMEKYRNENKTLTGQALTASALQDELDIAKERLSHADKLEVELSRYRERMKEAQFYQGRSEKLAEENRLLSESNQLLNEKLETVRRRVGDVDEMERRLGEYKQEMAEMTLERDRMNELIEENVQLYLNNKMSWSESAHLMAELDQMKSNQKEGSSGHSSLSDQLSVEIQGRVNRLEIENQRLVTLLDAATGDTIVESSEKFCSLKRTNDELQLKHARLVESESGLRQLTQQLQEQCDGHAHEMRRLQDVVCSLNEENGSLSSNWATDSRQLTDTVQQLSRQNEAHSATIVRLTAVNSTLTDENSRLKTLLHEQAVGEKLREGKINKQLSHNVLPSDILCDVSAVSCDVPNSSCVVSSDVCSATCCDMVQADHVTKQNNHLRRVVSLLQHALQDRLLNSVDSHTEVSNTQEIDTQLMGITSGRAVSGYHEYTESDRLSVNTHKNALCLQDVFAAFKRFVQMLQINETDTSFESKLNQLSYAISEFSDQLNSSMYVDDTNLSSTAVCNLFQNNMICIHSVADSTDWLIKLCEISLDNYQLTRNKRMVDAKNTQLNDESMKIKQKLSAVFKENAETQNRLNDLQSYCAAIENEKHRLNESYTVCQKSRDELQQQCTELNHQLALIREQHTDVSDLYRVASTRLSELTSQVEGHQRNMDKMSLGMSKLFSRCEMLTQLNSAIDEDRRILMNQITILLSQHQKLLTTAMTEKNNFHEEEKQLAEKMFEIKRQKEKLEEKIMAHYRQMDNYVPKRNRHFGHSLVTRMRRASSDWITRRPQQTRTHADLDSGPASLNVPTQCTSVPDVCSSPSHHISSADSSDFSARFDSDLERLPNVESPSIYSPIHSCRSFKQLNSVGLPFSNDIRTGDVSGAFVCDTLMNCPPGEIHSADIVSLGKHNTAPWSCDTDIQSTDSRHKTTISINETGADVVINNNLTSTPRPARAQGDTSVSATAHLSCSITSSSPLMLPHRSHSLRRPDNNRAQKKSARCSAHHLPARHRHLAAEHGSTCTVSSARTCDVTLGTCVTSVSEVTDGRRSARYTRPSAEWFEYGCV